MKRLLIVIWMCCSVYLSSGSVQLGLDRIFLDPYALELKGKNIGLLTNASAIDSQGKNAFDLFYLHQKKLDYTLYAAFAPEHGLDAKLAAFDFFEDSQKNKISIFSLHGRTKRPTDEMMKDLDLIVFDLQTVGVRCYTYETTLTYMMEKAAELKIPVYVLDRPNPRGGLAMAGETLQEKYRCFFSYNSVPFCHGLTIGELARFVNSEQNIQCGLTVVPMTGWERFMTYQETNLPWQPPSPNIPDGETALVYPATILLGETLEIVSVDLRGQKPFKRFGAPWLNGQEFVSLLNERNLPGVVFQAENFRPQWGKYENEPCEGVFIKVTSAKLFQPLQTQYAIFEELQQAYPAEFKYHLDLAYQKGRKKACSYLIGTDRLVNELEVSCNLVEDMKLHETYYIRDFAEKRQKYLIY